MKKLFRPPQADYYPYYEDKLAAQKTTELDFHALVVQPIETMLAQVTAFIPNLLAAFYILVFGWILAKLFEFVAYKFLNAIHFDKLVDKIGIAQLLNEGNAKVSASKWFSTLIFWMGIFISIGMALDEIRLRVASIRVDDILHMFTSILSAVVVLVLGMFLSVIMARIVKASAATLKIPKGDIFAGITQWVILVSTLMLSLLQINIPPDFILIGIAVVFVTLCITFVIAFGIGGRVWAGKVLDKIL